MYATRAFLASLLLAASGASARAQTAPPDAEIFIAPLTATPAGVVVGRPENVTNRPGYDNQPAFTADGRSLLFTSTREDGQSDIYRYDIAARTTARVTRTTESEYSATVMPDGARFSVIRVEADSTQRLWSFSRDGTDARLVLERVKPVGYHAWADDHSLALFVLGARGAPNTLQMADTRTGEAKVVAERIGRALQRVPGRRAVSFVHHAGTDSAMITTLDFATGAVSPLVRPPAGGEYHVWLRDGSLLVSSGNALYRRAATGGASGGGGAWEKVVSFEDPRLARVSRLALSPSGDRLAIVGERAAAR